MVRRTVSFAGEVAGKPEATERHARLAAGALYHVMTAVLMAAEGAKAGAETGGDARRLLLARMVLDHRLAAQDPLAIADVRFDEAAEALLLADEPVPLAKAAAVLGL